MYPNKTVCADSIQIKGDVEIQRQSSYIILAYTGMLSLVSIPPAMMLGSWSDQGGRKLGMVLPSLLALVSSCVFIAMAVVESASAYWGVAAALVSGLSGSHVSVFLSCFSYVADVADASSRTRRMALAESMVFVGGTAGFLLSGFLLTRFGFVATFGVCCAFHVLSVLYVLLWLPSPDRTTQTLLADSQEEAGSVPLGLSVLTYAGRSFKTMFRERRDGEKHKLLLLMICTFLNNLIAMGPHAHLLHARG